MTWYDAQFDDGARRYTVGPFDTPEDADEYGQTHHGERIAYTGWAERKGRRELEQLIGALAAGDAKLATAGAANQRRGVVTRWDPGATHGFITDNSGRSWFASRDDLPGGLIELTVHTKVVFAGAPNPKPGKRYPQAHSIQPVEEPPQ